MTASISGTIKSEGSEPRPGVAVRLEHEPTGSVFARISDDNGKYVFESIRVGGPYILSVTPEGGEKVQKGHIHLKTGEALSEDFVI